MRGLDRALRKQLLRLRDKRRVRDAQGVAYLEGVSPFLQACGAGHGLDLIVWSPILLRSSSAQKLVRLRRREGVETVEVSPEEFRAFCGGPRASGIAAVVRQRWRRLGEVDPDAGLCWIALERIRSPGNLGTILRTAEATGVAGLVLLGPSIDPFALTALRASMGALFHLQLARTTHHRLRAWAAAENVRLLGTSPGASQLYTEPPAGGRKVVLLGEEREGLSEAALALCHDRVRLPIVGRGDSLNVAVAAGVVLYDLLRRRGPG